MTVSGAGSVSAVMLQSILSMRSQLDDLQRQLGTGQKSDTYAGLGLDRGLTVSLNAQLAALGSYGDTINMVNTRISVGAAALEQMASFGDEVQTAALSNVFDPDNNGQTTGQKTALTDLGSFIGLLNARVGNRYIFSGQATDRPAVETLDHILNGDGAKAGLKQVIDERNQADLGADGLGRLAIAAPTSTSVSLAETAGATGSPFGLKLAGVTSNLTGATVTGPSGSPPSIAVDLGGTNPDPGDTIEYQFTLPDGTTDSITLTATIDSPPGANQFTIGATPDDTASNLKTALTSAVTRLGQTSLSAASAIAASNDFFDEPPRRVNGSPPSGSTALVSGIADTVSWYTGGSTTGSIRATATAQIDQSITVSYGMQANEQGIRSVLQNIATAAAVTFSATDSNAEARSAALNVRLNSNLGAPSGTQSIQSIAIDLATAQTSIKAATDRQRQTSSMLKDLLQKVSTVPPEQVGAQLLALQTTLQASLETTAMLSKLSLVNYMPG